MTCPSGILSGEYITLKENIEPREFTFEPWDNTIYPEEEEIKSPKGPSNWNKFSVFFNQHRWVMIVCIIIFVIIVIGLIAGFLTQNYYTTEPAPSTIFGNYVPDFNPGATSTPTVPIAGSGSGLSKSSCTSANNAKYSGGSCSCLPPWTGSTCQMLEYSQDYYALGTLTSSDYTAGAVQLSSPSQYLTYDSSGNTVNGCTTVCDANPACLGVKWDQQNLTCNLLLNSFQINENYVYYYNGTNNIYLKKTTQSKVLFPSFVVFSNYQPSQVLRPAAFTKDLPTSSNPEGPQPYVNSVKCGVISSVNDPQSTPTTEIYRLVTRNIRGIISQNTFSINEAISWLSTGNIPSTVVIDSSSPGNTLINLPTSFGNLFYAYYQTQ